MRSTILKRAGAGLLTAAMLASQALCFPASAAGTQDLYVGYSSKANNFATVQEAVNKAASLNPASESDRVTIHIAPGTYREQVKVETPFITFKNDEPNKDVVLTWYYGIGYKYYSAGEKGWYDANAAKSHSTKRVANYRWGGTVLLLPKATYFKAEHITFENSFNRYVTDEEIRDGVELSGDTSVSSINFKRQKGADVRTKAATERGAALSADAAYCEFYDCDFLSSQDTLYTGGAPQYYKECHIEGNTDYIFGDSSAVFDDCELCFYGYSDNGYSGYITAARDEKDADTGYLFNNCTVTTASGMKHKAGYLGRPWRDTAKVLFLNTTLSKDGLIDPAGWYKMSNVEPQNVAGFKEYGTKLANGTAVDLSKRKGHKLSASDAGKIKLTNYMKSWTPSYLSVAPQQPSGPTPSATNDAITLCGGWYETAFAEWDANKIGSNVKVSYRTGNGSFTSVDKELIRGNRVDIPGLKGGTAYEVKIEGSTGTAGCTVTPMAYDRSGYAHYNFNSGVGAYNNDGTLKPDVQVIYVTNSNKDSITYGGKTGLFDIFNSAKPKNVVFRFVGKIDVPRGAKANDGKQNDGSNMLYLQNAENVTIEGIGYNADLNQWGFEMKRCKSCEVRNLWLGQYPDDGISMSGSSDSRSSHMWIHNNTIEKGVNKYAGNGVVDADKADGDGSADIKWSDYVTLSYNQFVNCHKTSLVGGGPSQFQDFITYHHNWFRNTESRNPRARNTHIHSYNNYFTNNKQYGIGASYNSKIFSESNYFEKTNLPLDAVNMGSDAYSGTIKSYNDKFDGCTMGSGLAYKIVSNRNDKANIPNLKSGGEAYDNFDLNLYSYQPQTPDQAKNTVMEFSGRMQQKAYGSASVTPVVTEPDKPLQGTLIRDLTIHDTANAAKWSIASGIRNGDAVFSDRAVTFTAVPAFLADAEYIRTSCDSKKYTGEEASFTTAQDATVYIGLDSRLNDDRYPTWLSAWTKTADVMTDNGDPVVMYELYRKDVKAGESVTVGMIGQSSCVNLFAAVVPYQESQPVVGDVDNDGTCDAADIVMLQKWLHCTGTLTNAEAADLNGDGCVDVFDLALLKREVLHAQSSPEPTVHLKSVYEPAGFQFSGKAYLVGDSTVCEYPEQTALSLDRYGWGMKLGGQFNNVQVTNLALSGRSSRSFLAEPNYQTLKNSIGKGDYLFIQFGHNDEKTDEATHPGVGTYPGLDPATLDGNGKDTQGRYSYEYLLTAYYIDLAKSKGAVPVLITPITRRGSDGTANYKQHTPYQQAMIGLGKSKNVPVIDMTELTRQLYTDLYSSGGAAETAKLHCYKDDAHTTVDNTHLSSSGAQKLAEMIAEQTKELGLTIGEYAK